MKLLTFKAVINLNFFQNDAELNELRNELSIALLKIRTLEQDKQNLEESLKISQMQKEMMLDETDKIQNFQQQEINKLKNLLLFREQVNKTS